MFIRSIKVRSSAGTIHEYVRIVASVREDGQVRQKVVANLGRRDTLEAVLPLLNRFLQGEADSQQDLAKQLAQEGRIEVQEASTWGPGPARSLGQPGKMGRLRPGLRFCKTNLRVVMFS